MVYLDPKIKANLGQSTSEPLPRRFYAQLLDRLTGEGARLVLFDILFDEPGKDPAVDSQFAQAIRRNGRVVLVGYMLTTVQHGDIAVTSAMPPTPALAEAAAGWGLAGVSPDRDDQAVRRLDTGTDTVPSVTWVAAEILKSPATKNPETRLTPRWLNYDCEASALNAANLDQVLAKDGLTNGYFRNKIVIVGNLARGGGLAGAEQDEFATPYGQTAPGAAIHAFGLLNLLHQDWLTRMSFAGETALVWIWGILISVIVTRLRPAAAATAAVVGAGAITLFALWLQARQGVWFSWLIPAGAQTSLALVWSVGFQYAVEARRRRKLRRAFSAYLSPHLADRIAESEFELSLGGKEVEATIMFTDLEGFTTLSEALPPAEVSRILTSYFNETTQAILKEDGTIIKYLGDAVMAAWGAPLVEPRPASRAVLAALGMQQAGRKEIAGRRLRTRFGINTGLVLAGNLGSDFRFDYTLIGKSANLASRLEGLNKYLGTEILISESVQRELEEHIFVRAVGSFIVVGATEPIRVYEVLGFTANFQPPPQWLDTFAKGLEHFTKRELEAAEQLFRKTIELRGQDGPADFYLEEIAKAMRTPGSATDWNGHIRLESK
jgi:adenylate cyclase